MGGGGDNTKVEYVFKCFYQVKCFCIGVNNGVISFNIARFVRRYYGKKYVNGVLKVRVLVKESRCRWKTTDKPSNNKRKQDLP